MTTVTYTLSGALVGDLWMPHARAAKSVHASNDAERFTERPTLRDLVGLVEAEHGGDFASAPLFTADSVLIVERSEGVHTLVTRTRVVPLTSCQSISDYVAADEYAADYLGDY